jgi:hypothetical protein
MVPPPGTPANGLMPVSRKPPISRRPSPRGPPKPDAVIEKASIVVEDQSKVTEGSAVLSVRVETGRW